MSEALKRLVNVQFDFSIVTSHMDQVNFVSEYWKVNEAQ